MSARVLKRQLRELLEADAARQAARAKTSRKRRRRRRAALAAASRPDPDAAERAAEEANLAYFKAASGAQEEARSVLDTLTSQKAAPAVTTGEEAVRRRPMLVPTFDSEDSEPNKDLD